MTFGSIQGGKFLASLTTISISRKIISEFITTTAVVGSVVVVVVVAAAAVVTVVVV
jgi:hypothetical protein